MKSVLLLLSFSPLGKGHSAGRAEGQCSVSWLPPLQGYKHPRLGIGAGISYLWLSLWPQDVSGVHLYGPWGLGDLIWLCVDSKPVHHAQPNECFGFLC